MPWLRGRALTHLFFSVLVIASMIWTGYSFLFAQRTPEWPQVAIFATLLLFLISERVNALIGIIGEQEREDVFKVSLKNIESMFFGTVQLSHIGTGREGLVHLINAMEGDAITIKDTIIRHVLNASYRNSEIYKSHFTPALARYLSKNGRYIVVGNSVGLEGSAALERSESEDVFIQEIDINVPYTNFVLIERPSNRREVLFGWDYTHTEVGHVFLSSHPEVIRYFDGLFAALQRLAKPIDSGPPPLR